ncbi:AAA family ATPase [Veillonella sp.]|uniref:AAA family ATPase n=1 Tax=Veillonella sp. TaxID=1926307 RepID=UPI0026003542|nr:AAA family ATPase [Veillonella sp.]
MFYIKELSILANDKVSKLMFIPGVNIIYGPSNTGKSMILDCIDYMLGAKEHRFDAKLKIQKNGIVIDNNGKSVYISRELNSTKLEVISNVEGIKSQTYVVSKGKNSINNLWLQLMEIPIGTKILSTQSGKTQGLSVRTIYHTFLIDEDRVQEKGSILKQRKGIGGKVGVPVLTALMYLGTGNNYLPKDSYIDPQIKRARDEGILELVNRGMGFLEDQKSLVDEEISLMDTDEIKKDIDLTINDISAAEGTLKEALESCRSIGDELNKVIRQLSEDEVLLNRNELLLSQYKSDIQRLTFIAEGGISAKEIKPLSKCPFCNSEISPEQPIDYIDAIIAEEKNIEIQVKDLQSVQAALREEHDELEKKRKEKSTARNQVEERIRGELKPKIQQLRKQLDEYQKSLQYAEMTSMIKKFSGFLRTERNAVENEEVEDVKFDAKEKFKEVFQKYLDEELEMLLKSCAYPDYVDSWFNFNDCDVVVNGHNKRSQGKGFRAYLNTIVAIAMQNCLVKMGNYHPALFIVDSPILSLKEKDSDDGIQLTGPMKSHLFQYFLNRKSSPQTIVIENELPAIDYTKANLIQFTKDKNNGRYGLILGYQE